MIIFQNKYKKSFIALSLFFLSALAFLFTSWKQPVESKQQFQEELWVDSVMSSMTIEERIGQLFMVAAYSNKTEKHTKEIELLITKSGIGGLIFFQGGPVRQANLTNHYQQLSKVPLMIGMDAEWGLGMRLDSTLSFPKQMTLGAIQDNTAIYAMGKEIARQCRRIGVHINFAPVVDINSNPLNPVIGMRSFGENKYEVANKGIAYMKGMQDHYVMACAKHFPGHGDTESDSHLSLPILTHDKKRLNDIEWHPFKQLIKDSLMSVMVGHIHVPSLDNRQNMAATLSKEITTTILKEELSFKGLVFTDALNMKGVSSFYKPGDVDARALLAGNDVLLFSEDVPTAIDKIQRSLKKGEFTEEELNTRVRKILRAKYWFGLNHYMPIETKSLHDDLTHSKGKALQLSLYAKAITVVTNKKNELPIGSIEMRSFASLSIGLDSGNNFQNTLSLYAPLDYFSVPKNADAVQFEKLLIQLANYETIIIDLHGVNNFNTKNYGITENTIKFIEKISSQKNVLLSVFGNPYALKFFPTSATLICAYEDNEITQKLVPQLLFGGIQATGKLPVTAHNNFPVGKGISTSTEIKRLSYAFPENVGIDSKTLSYVDSICLKAINEGATPGCQVLIAREGKIIYDKNFGYLTYQKNPFGSVLPTSIYDIASITKVAGTLQAFMFLEERGLIDLDKKTSFYLHDLKGTNKEDLELRDILTHQAGLTPFIPHWKKTVDTSGFDTLYYSKVKSSAFPNEVIPGVYSLASMEDSLWKWTVNSALIGENKQKDSSKKKKEFTEKQYVYSDLGFYIAKRIVETILNQPVDEFMQDNFYTPLGLRHLVYKPLEKGVPAQRIAPTEEDKYFRKSLIQGNVHDQGAAMLGGVGGHAGIFSNASDLAVLMQMNLQQGTYGGVRYFLPTTVERFSKRQFDTNRRGLGWDKPEGAGQGPTSYHAPSSTFGHTGFTGTCAWIDPDKKILYIFLSNRVYKDASNGKLVRLGVRTAIQDVLYKSMVNYKE